MLWIGILPALAVVCVRNFVKEPEVWVENRRRQRDQQREVHAPLFSIFKPRLLLNTLTACWWMASGFVVYYSIWRCSRRICSATCTCAGAAIGETAIAANLVAFLASGLGLGGRHPSAAAGR